MSTPRHSLQERQRQAELLRTNLQPLHPPLAPGRSRSQEKASAPSDEVSAKTSPTLKARVLLRRRTGNANAGPRESKSASGKNPEASSTILIHSSTRRLPPGPYASIAAAPPSQAPEPSLTMLVVDADVASLPTLGSKSQGSWGKSAVSSILSELPDQLASVVREPSSMLAPTQRSPLFDAGTLSSHISTALSKGLRRDWTAPPSQESRPSITELISRKDPNDDEDAKNNSKVTPTPPPSPFPLGLSFHPRQLVHLSSGVSLPSWAVGFWEREIDIKGKYPLSPKSTLLTSLRASRTNIEDLTLKLVSRGTLFGISDRNTQTGAPSTSSEVAGDQRATAIPKIANAGVPCTLSASLVSDLRNRRTVALDATFGRLDKDSLSVIAAASRLDSVSYAVATSQLLSPTLKLCTRANGCVERDQVKLLQKLLVQAIFQEEIKGSYSFSPVISFQPGRVPFEGGVILQRSLRKEQGMDAGSLSFKWFVNSKGSFHLFAKISGGNSDLQEYEE